MKQNLGPGPVLTICSLLLGVIPVMGPARAAAHYQILLDMNDVSNANDLRGTALIQGSDGALYGTTEIGTNAGTIFKVNRDGTGYRVLYNFKGIGGDGTYPVRGVVEGGDGALYGTTALGGAYDNGTVFKLNKDGSGYKVLHSFSGYPDDGGAPDLEPYCANELLIGSDGSIYGTTDRGGTYDWGTAFKLNKDGSGYAVLYSFGRPADDGIHDYGLFPCGGLIEGSDG